MFDTRQGLAFCGDSYLVFFHSHVTAVERKKVLDILPKVQVERYS